MSRPALSSTRSLVIKLGTHLLTDKARKLDSPFLASIADQVVSLRAKNVRVTLVSSGAVAAGLVELKLDKRPTDLANLQAVAAVGQRRLMDAWAAAFAPHSIPVAQILLTRDDVDHRARFLNLRNTIHAVHDLGGVPIINENDTISTDELVEISFGDNDLLAAMVANALRADLLALLTVVDGIQDRDGVPVRLVEDVAAARELVRVEKSSLGKGGMNSKVEAARMMLSAGEAMIVADGRTPDVLIKILAGEEVGTLFASSREKRSSRSRWIGSAKPLGTIHIDAGAALAVAEKNRSLLPAGITRVEGDFARGDVVAITSPDSKEIARGLTNYAAADLRAIAGKKSAEVRALLAERSYDEVVHRDNLVLS